MKSRIRKTVALVVLATFANFVPPARALKTKMGSIDSGPEAGAILLNRYSQSSWAVKLIAEARQ
jgi:hypothetical protein